MACVVWYMICVYSELTCLNLWWETGIPEELGLKSEVYDVIDFVLVSFPGYRANLGTRLISKTT